LACQRRKLAGVPLIVMSLGSLCFTARFLGELGVRAFAGPFDWIFSSPALVAHALNDDFAAFLDRRLLVRNGGNTAGHSLYSPMLARTTVFNHHDPSSNEGHEYFERTVARVRKILRSSVRKVFLMCSLERREQLDEEAVSRLFAALALMTSNFELVAVKIVAPAPPESSCGARLLRRAAAGAGGSCVLRIHELLCRRGVGHAGLTLLDPADNADLARVLFDGASDGDGDGDGDGDAPDKIKSRIVPDPLGKPGRWRAGGAQKYGDDGYMIDRRHLQHKHKQRG
jgi:hypothetical protein